MKTALLLLALALTYGVCRAETIKLRSGPDVEGKVLSIDAASVALDGGRTLPRAEVAEIQLTAQAAARPGATASSVSAQDQAAARADFAQAAELAKKYPGSNGLTLLDSVADTLNPDGTALYREHEVKQILKDSLKQAWGQIIACAEEGRDRVKIIKADVYNPDGGIYTLDPSRIKTSKPQEEGGDFFTSGEICTQYVLPNVQQGSIIDYETEMETYNPFRKDFFFPEDGFQGDQGPIARSEFFVTLPAGTSFYYSVKNFSGLGSDKPVISSAGGNTTYAWALDNVPPIVGEPQMPAYEDIAPFVRGAIFKDWDRIFDWMGKMHREHSQAGPELTKFTLDLIKGSRTDEEKAARIYHYVQKDIRYIAVKVGVASGWGGYDANLTWKRRYGCCIDKSLLLVAMLKVAGIPASTVILNTNNLQETDFSIPQIGFDHAITVAEIGGKHVFLDSTNYDYTYPEIASFDYGVHVLNMFAKKIDYVPVPAPADNGDFCDYNVALSSGGAADVKEAIRFTGSREGGWRGWFRSMKKEEQKQTFQSFSKSDYPSAELLSWEVGNAETIDKPFSLSMEYAVPDYTQRAGDILIVKLPDFEINPYSIKEISLDKRRYPIKYEASMGKYRSYHISLPKNYELVSLPPKMELKDKYVSFTAGCEKTSSTEITCSVSWERPVRIVPPADYAGYKALLQKAASYTKSQLFLRDLSAGRAAASKEK
jgi:transglutaminase-like putative cysteine protease